MKTVRIGNGCGFWGDSIDAPIRLAETGQLDYLTLEYLAELTMSILALLKQRDPKAGYATDFFDLLPRLIPSLKSQPKLKIVTNAGGMNPRGGAELARTILNQHGFATERIGVVTGDDLLPRLDELLANGHRLEHLDTHQPLSSIRGRVVSANAYLGSQPIAEALKLGARFVMTGRVADACLTVGPLIHELGWSSIDQLAAGTVAGHLIECGAQVTGGLWMNADDSTNLAEVGYPIAVVAEDGTIRITKPENQGGVVNRETVSEQLLYEVGDPARYISPDVVADFTSVQLQEESPNCIAIRGSRGLPATDSYKVSIAYRDGFTAAGTLVIVGPNAVVTARKSGEILLARLKRAGFEYTHSLIEVIGQGSEVTLRVAVRDANKSAVDRFTKEFAPLVTSGYPGTTGYTTGRAAVREVFAYWPALIAKSAVSAKVEFL
jgi:Acyclic terpene utilisation family protein AtuA